MKNVELSKNELIALRSILGICIEQYNTSGGDIDYAGLGESSLNVMRVLLNKIPDPTKYTLKINTTYSASDDMTFILEEVYDKDGNPVSTECVGFYYGEPNEIDTNSYYGKLRADY